MTPVSTVLRDLARKFIASENGKVPGVCTGGSQYICDLLGEPGTVADYESQEEALSLLQAYGQGRGFSEFYTYREDRFEYEVDTYELGLRRAAWLLFAADRYDEGVR